MSTSITPTRSSPWYSQGLNFSCTQCGRCCTGPAGYVWFSEDEGKRIADYLQLDETTFRRRFAHRANGKWSLNENKTAHGQDCVFLRRSDQGQALCSIYPVRPVQCRTWPFWHENLRTPTDWRRAAKTCPGIDQGRFYAIEQIRIIRDSNPPD